MKSFTINLSPVKILIAFGTLVLSWISYISLEAINNSKAISVLEEKRSSDNRQDKELREIRRTIQDMTVLFFEHHDDEEEELTPIERPSDFSAAQMIIEDLIKTRAFNKKTQ